MTAAAPHFVVETHRNGTTEVVVVQGDVDIATAPLLRAVLDTVVALTFEIVTGRPEVRRAG